MTSQAILQASTAIFVGLLIIAAITDVLWLRIPNWISAGVVLVFLLAAMAEPRSAGWWGSHLGAGGLVFLVGMAIFALGKIGGGDVKLLTGAALWFGLAALPVLLLLIGLVGGVVSVVCLLLRGSGYGASLDYFGLHAVVLEKGQGVPYAVAIAAGCWLMPGGILT